MRSSCNRQQLFEKRHGVSAELIGRNIQEFLQEMMHKEGSGESIAAHLTELKSAARIISSSAKVSYSFRDKAYN